MTPRMEFDVRFYLVAILFIIFDLEIAFLFPWAISLGNLGALGLVNDDFSIYFNNQDLFMNGKKGALNGNEN